MTHDIPLLLAAAFYLVATAVLYHSIKIQSPGWRKTSLAFGTAGAVVHTGVQIVQWFGHGPPDVSLPHLMSLCALVIILLVISSALSRKSLYPAGLIAFPIAAGVLLMEWVFPRHAIPLNEVSAGVAVHLISSVLAFGVLSIAGVYALLVSIIDHFLRRHHLSPLVSALPALDVLESLLFRLIAVGFLLLTVSLVSGSVFINDIFAQHLVHKTILSIITWLLFALLLWGRWRYGWRGSLAVRMTLAGIVLLLLAYFGSKLVLEVILGRTWQS